MAIINSSLSCGLDSQGQPRPIGVTDPVAATATLTSDGTNPVDNDTVSIGSITYRFKDTLARAYDVKIAGSAAVTLDNFKTAVNRSGTDGTQYGTGTAAHPDVTATTNTDTTQAIQAKQAGSVGNSISTTETSAHLAW